MVIFICILEMEPKSIEWNHAFLPRIGEHLSINDFLNDLDQSIVHDDIMIITDIQWFKLNGENTTVYFLERDDSEIRNVEIFRRN